MIYLYQNKHGANHPRTEDILRKILPSLKNKNVIAFTEMHNFWLDYYNCEMPKNFMHIAASSKEDIIDFIKKVPDNSVIICSTFEMLPFKEEAKDPASIPMSLYAAYCKTICNLSTDKNLDFYGFMRNIPKTMGYHADRITILRQDEIIKNRFGYTTPKDDDEIFREDIEFSNDMKSSTTFKHVHYD